MQSNHQSLFSAPPKLSLASLFPALQQSPQQRKAFTVASALGLTGKHVYAGTVPPEEVARRRAANRVARRQRRVNRLRHQ